MTDKKIKKILVPLDGSRNSLRGLDTAINIARQTHAMITGLYIAHMPAIYAIHPLGFMDPGLQRSAKKFLAAAKLRAAKKGIMFNAKMLGGNPGYDIVRFAHNKKNKIDMIVIGSRGMGSTKELFLGSTSNYVVHKSKIPVLLIK